MLFVMVVRKIKRGSIKLIAGCLSLIMLFTLTACTKNVTVVEHDSSIMGEPVDIGTTEGKISIVPKQISLPSQFPNAVAGDGSVIYHIGCCENDLIIHTLDVVSGQWIFFSEIPDLMDEVSYIYGTVSGGRLIAILEYENNNYSMLSLDTSTGECVDKGNLSEIDMGITNCVGYDNGFICYSSGEGAAYFYSIEGEFLNKLNYNGAILASISVISGMPVACLWRDDSYFLCSVNNSGFGRSTKIDMRIESSCISNSTYLANNEALYCFDVKDGTLKPILYWTDSGLIFTTSMVFVNQEGIAVIYDEIRASVFITNTQMETNRKELTIGAMQYGAELSQAISIFNSQNKEYVARLKLYALDEMDRFLVDIGSGDVLDIVCTGLHPGGVNLTYSMLDSGAFEDLLPFIDSDPELSRKDLFPNLLEGMTTDDGQLYELFSRFSVTSMITSENIATQIAGPEDLLALNRNLPQGYSLFGGLNKAMLMEYICQIASVQCIDYETGTCDFSRGNFSKWLELYKNFQPYDQNIYDGYLIAVSESVNPYIAANCRRLFGDDYVYMAWPNEDENLLLSSGIGGGYCILSTSQNKEAAWQLLRTLLLPACQNSSNAIGFPIIKEYFQDGLQALTEDDMETLDITTKDIDKITALLDTKMYVPRATEANRIIEEEVEHYAAGEKILDDTIAAIESRVGVYLAEQFR